MKRLTLEEAIGQTLHAKVQLGEDVLLRFAEGYVTLNTNYESYCIMDYTDGDAPLNEGALSRMTDRSLDELHVAGFIDGHQKHQAQIQREAFAQAWQAQQESALRAQYESLRKRFEPN